MPKPPITIKGLKTKTTSPSSHEKIKHIKQDTVNPNKDSTKIPKLSAVKPFKNVISYINKLVSTPVALFWLSNQAIFFFII